MGQSDSDVPDYHVDIRDVQSLSSREAVCAFFAHIGYNTEARIAQTPANLGITADSVTRQIRHIERVADQDNYLQVYLFEVDSVTISLTRSLARYFRDLSGRFLFVITSDYERIDFVLAEVYISAANGESRGLQPTRKPPVRPRILTVDRRNPKRVDLRVLNRFPYTESDPYAQYYKLLSAYSVADWSEEFFNNRALFSDYYLKERLPDMDEWKEDSRPAYNTLQKIFSSDGSVLPVLKCLGFSAVRADREKNMEEPSYRLHKQDDESKPLTVALTYPWNRSLDGPDETRDPDTPDENPGKVVVSILEKGETDWAIVTNGKLWRLYSRKAHSRATNYYEIDLEEVLAESSRYDSPGESFRYFWLLFRARAFEPFEALREREKRISTFLDSLLEGSIDYARELGERLKERVFAQIFPHFASGFIQYIRDVEGSEADLSRERLDTIFHGTLALLYRLLFLFYAESRDLLPVKEVRGYYEISLRKLTKETEEAAGNIQDEAPGRLEKAYRTDSAELYDRLTELFGVIDNGDPRINVPCYNGSLFITDPGDEYTSEAENARFLRDHRIPDRHLALGLDLMARDRDEKLHSLVFIDYKSLGVRQLGSIYEGLLEFKLEMAEGKLGIVKSKGREVYVPFRELSEAQQDRAERQGQIIRKGQVYLSNDRRERKATGSYYTPDYIVKYIVENTVGPVLEEKFDKMRPQFRKAERDYRNAVKNQEAFRKLGRPGSDPEKVADTYQPVVAELFDVSVLDPAMGSGHFLVEAVDFITDRMITFLNAFPWNPVVAMLRQTREIILEAMDKQGISIDVNRLIDVDLLKRHVLKRCVYGVDLNPMAVELAKVSLWLDCFTLGAPLSFLDHHLKCGNSLIGSQIDAIREKLESDLFGTQFAALITATVGGMMHVGELSDVTVEQVKESVQTFKDASDTSEPFKEVLDFWTAQYFVEQDEANQIRNTFLSGRFPQIKRGWYNELNSARSLALRSSEIALDRRFFHWELEFPEVFFGPRSGTIRAIAEKENPGFDAVIGNPPYVSAIQRKEALSESEQRYLKTKFVSASGAYDVYVVFFEQSTNLVRRGCLTSMITPNKFLSAPYARAFREYISDNACLTSVFNLSRVRVFADPSVYPMISLIQNRLPDNEYSITIRVPKEPHNPLDVVKAEHSSGSLTSLPDLIWGFLISEQLPLLLKIDRVSQQTQQCSIVRASSTAAEADEYDKALSDKEMDDCKMFVNTGIIDRYTTLWGTNPLTHRGTTFSTPYLRLGHPAVSGDRRTQYGKPKIIFAKLALQVEAFFDKQGEYASANTNFVYDSKYNLGYLTALLNSKLLSMVYVEYFGALAMGSGYLQFQAPQLKILPIRYIFFTTPQNEREWQVAELRKSCEKADSDDILDRINELLTKDANGNFAAFEHSISVKDAVARSYITKEDAQKSALRTDSPSGYDGNGNPLESSDVVHDFLAHLAQEMIDMNEDIQTEQKRFLSRMENQLYILPDKKGNTGIEALSGKTTMKRYLGDYQKGEDAADFADIFKVLQNNRSKIRANLSDAAFVRMLEREYEKSLEILLPIKEQLAKTDRLIDQIVYKLYGLTEEEIAIVEGRN